MEWDIKSDFQVICKWNEISLSGFQVINSAFGKEFSHVAPMKERMPSFHISTRLIIKTHMDVRKLMIMVYIYIKVSISGILMCRNLKVERLNWFKWLSIHSSLHVVIGPPLHPPTHPCFCPPTQCLLPPLPLSLIYSLIHPFTHPPIQLALIDGLLFCQALGWRPKRCSYKHCGPLPKDLGRQAQTFSYPRVEYATDC